jgi:hypothetical protein
MSGYIGCLSSLVIIRENQSSDDAISFNPRIIYVDIVSRHKIIIFLLIAYSLSCEITDNRLYRYGSKEIGYIVFFVLIKNVIIQLNICILLFLEDRILIRFISFQKQMKLILLFVLFESIIARGM